LLTSGNFGKAGQFLALDPAAPEAATIGGIVATADTGSLRQRYGGVVTSCWALPLSERTNCQSWGRVVKNVAGYDLMKLFTGSYGTLGFSLLLRFGSIRCLKHLERWFLLARLMPLRKHPQPCELLL